MMPAALSLRPAQQEALRYSGGKMAIAAAPGAGKTFILTQLIVRLIGDLGARPDEILVLTFMRSAALNFRQRAAAELARRGKTARGLRATTIHAFCQGILRQELGRFEALEDDVDGAPAGPARTIVSDSVRRAVLSAGLEAFLAGPERSPALDEALARRRRVEVLDEIVATASRAISTAKQAERDPRDLAVPGAPEIGFLARHYEAHLERGGLIDFDDMIGHTVRLLAERPDVLAYYQDRIRFLLEDEAQDSTPLQNRLLELLAGRHGNLVRVGDPNQAILASFTSNDPRFFRAFCRTVPTVAMSESSRSAPAIVQLANSLAEIASRHPDPEIRQALGGEPIGLSTAGPRNPDEAHLTWTAHPSKDQEVTTVLAEVRQYMREHPAHSCAILCASNGMILEASRGMAYLPAARAMGLALGASDADAPDARAVVATFDLALALLDATSDDPVAQLAELAQQRARALGDRTRLGLSGRALAALRELGIERLVRPAGLRPARPQGIPEPAYAAAIETARAIDRLLAWRMRPAAELLLAIAHDLLAGRSGALLLAGRLAQLAPYAESRAGDPRRSRLAVLREALAELTDDAASALLGPGDPPEARPGQLSILTVHKSKGAEYDAVWIPNIGYYHDGVSHFPWEPAEVRQRSVGELLAERAARGAFEPAEGPPGPAAVQEARLADNRAVIAERLRLLYVGLTRARTRLSLSCYSLKGPLAPRHVLELTRGLAP